MAESGEFELISRIKHEGTEPRENRFGPLFFQKNYQTLVRIEGLDPVRLSNKEAEILWLLMSVSKEDKEAHRWIGGYVSTADFEGWFNRSLPDEKEIPMSNSVEVTLGKLSRKLQAATSGEVYVENDRGRGYYLQLCSQGDQFPDSHRATPEEREQLRQQKINERERLARHIATALHLGWSMRAIGHLTGRSSGAISHIVSDLSGGRGVGGTNLFITRYVPTEEEKVAFEKQYGKAPRKRK
jgi:DNA-binding winged helix-turn-helix (wHTH) protein